MAKHFENVADMKTLIETKKLTNDGLLSLESYTETAAVSTVDISPELTD